MTLTNSLSPSYRHMLCYSGMFYIITGKVGWAAYLNWKQIRTMLAEGMQIGSHTVHHVNMGSLLMYSTALAQHELQASQTVLQNHLGIVIQQFCYPSGEPFRHGTLSAQQQIVSLLAADGYIGATTDPGISGTIQHSPLRLATHPRRRPLHPAILYPHPPLVILKCTGWACPSPARPSPCCPHPRAI